MTPSLDTTVMTSGDPASMDSKNMSSAAGESPVSDLSSGSGPGTERRASPREGLAPCRGATIRSVPVTAPPSDSGAATPVNVCWRSIARLSIAPVVGAHYLPSIAPIPLELTNIGQMGRAVVRQLFPAVEAPLCNAVERELCRGRTRVVCQSLRTGAGPGEPRSILCRK